MKLINSFTYDNYNKEVFKISKRLLIYSLIIFIIGFIIILFKLSFQCRIHYLIEKNENNYYQVIVPYEELSIWMNKNKIYYKNDSYSYHVVEIDKESIFQNSQVYLQLLIEVDKLSESIPLLEISLENNDMTLWDYLNNKFRGK